MASSEGVTEQLSREEQLRIWLEQKKSKKESARKGANTKPTTNPSHIQPRIRCRVRHREAESYNSQADRSIRTSSTRETSNVAVRLFEQKTVSALLKTKKTSPAKGNEVTSPPRTRTPIPSVNQDLKSSTEPQTLGSRVKNSRPQRKSTTDIPCKEEETTSKNESEYEDEDERYQELPNTYCTSSLRAEDCITEGKILALKEDPEFVSPLSWSTMKFINSPSLKNSVRCDDSSEDEGEDIFYSQVDKYAVAIEPGTYPQIITTINDLEEKTSPWMIPPSQITTERPRIEPQLRARLEWVSDDSEDWGFCLSPDGPGDEPFQSDALEDIPLETTCNAGETMFDVPPRPLPTDADLIETARFGDDDGKNSQDKEDENYDSANQIKSAIDDEEKSFDWRDNLSPDFQQQNPRRKRTDASLLILPKPSPLENPEDGDDENSNTDQERTCFINQRRRRNMTKDRADNPCNDARSDPFENEVEDCEESVFSSKIDGELSVLNTTRSTTFESRSPTAESSSGKYRSDTDKRDSPIDERIKSTISCEDETETSVKFESLNTSQTSAVDEGRMVDQLSDETAAKKPIHGETNAGCEKRSFDTPRVPEYEVRCGEKTILETVVERPHSLERSLSEGNTTVCRECADKDSHIAELRWQVDHLLLEKKKLENKLHSIRKGYENRITPFRDLFDDLSHLRSANQKLKSENRQVNATLQSTVANLQRQMNDALAKALDKKSELESELGEAKRIIDELRERVERSEENESIVSLIGESIEEESV